MGRYTGKKCRLLSMFGLTVSFFVVEIVVGYMTNSMALIADSFHMLSDIAALIIAFLSVKMVPRVWDKNTYGWARAEVLGALVNAVFLIALCFSISIESLKRFYEPEDIHDPVMILIVGSLGLIVNLLGLCLFHKHGAGGHGHSHGSHGHSHGAHSHLAVLANDSDVPKITAEYHSNNEPKKNSGTAGSQLNMHGVYLHVMGDALGSVVVIVSALIMWQTEWEYKKYVDPALSLVMVCIMIRGVWPLLVESALILLQTVPTHINIDILKKKILENIDGILAVHELHIWQLTGDKIIASAHIRCLNLSEYMKVAENIKVLFHNEGIHSTTIQPEFIDYQSADDTSEVCLLKCCKPLSSNGNLKKLSKSAQNTPTTGRHPTCFAEQKVPCFTEEENFKSLMFFQSTLQNKPAWQNNARNSQQHGHPRVGSVRSASYINATPNQPKFRSMISTSDFDPNKSSAVNDLTAEIDLSDELGVTAIQDSYEDTPMFTPRTNSRIVIVISKQSNV